MPEEGISYLPKDHLMTYEEMLKMMNVFAKNGINKVRITGGEPFLRKDLMSFLGQLVEIQGIEKVAITTNGTMISDKITPLKKLGIHSINLSLDTLDKDRFLKITRRDDYDKVMNTLHTLIDHEFELKVNMVVMKNHNLEDILPMLELSRHHNIEVRFIEEMPFNGEGDDARNGFMSHLDILNVIKKEYGDVEYLSKRYGDTSDQYKISGFSGSFGIIAAYSRTFCGSCNRIRVTPTGLLKTCLYDAGVMNLKDLMRNGADESEIEQALKSALSHRAKDGFEAEKNLLIPIHESMATIGG